MRGKAHLHLYLKWQMQMDRMIWQEENVNSSLQLFADRKKMKRSVFSTGQGLLNCTKCHPIRHLISHPQFHVVILGYSQTMWSLLAFYFLDVTCLILQRNQCQQLVKGPGATRERKLFASRFIVYLLYSAWELWKTVCWEEKHCLHVLDIWKYQSSGFLYVHDCSPQLFNIPSCRWVHCHYKRSRQCIFKSRATTKKTPDILKSRLQLRLSAAASLSKLQERRWKAEGGK